MITEQEIEAAEFRIFQTPKIWMCEKCWQRCIRDDDGAKMFHINIRQWDNRKYGHVITYDVDMTFNDGWCGNPLWMTLGVRESDTVTDIVDKCRYIYDNLKIIPYDHGDS